MYNNQTAWDCIMYGSILAERGNNFSVISDFELQLVEGRDNKKEEIYECKSMDIQISLGMYE